MNIIQRLCEKPHYAVLISQRGKGSINYGVIAAVEKTPSSRELDELTDQLRRVDTADRHLDKSSVRIWFQNRRREQKQLASSSSAATTTERLDTSVSRGCYWPESGLGHHQWLTTRDTVIGAATRLSRYCVAPTDITNTLYNYSLPHCDC